MGLLVFTSSFSFRSLRYRMRAMSLIPDLLFAFYALTLSRAQNLQVLHSVGDQCLHAAAVAVEGQKQRVALVGDNFLGVLHDPLCRPSSLFRRWSRIRVLLELAQRNGGLFFRACRLGLRGITRALPPTTILSSSTSIGAASSSVSTIRDSSPSFGSSSVYSNHKWHGGTTSSCTMISSMFLQVNDNPKPLLIRLRGFARRRLPFRFLRPSHRVCPEKKKDGTRACFWRASSSPKRADFD